MSSGSQRGLLNRQDNANPDGPTAVVVWHEVLLAYFAPAAIAGMAALITGQGELGIAAPTSIAGTSALAAALLASWLRGHGATNRRIASTTRRRLVATCTIAAIIAGLVTAAVVAGLLPSAIGFRRAPWLARMWLDLPLSAGISAAIVSWRWRSALDRRRGGSELNPNHANHGGSPGPMPETPELTTAVTHLGHWIAAHCPH